MRAAIVAGKYSGCGVSTYLFELKKAIDNYVGECDYYVYDCPSYFKSSDYENMKNLGVKLITIDKSEILNKNYDIVFAAYHVVPCQVTEEEASGYYNMFTYHLPNPKTVLVFNERRPSSIIKNYAYNTYDKYCLDINFLMSFDKILTFGADTVTSIFLRDKMGDAEYLKRFIPLYHMYTFDESKSNWVKAEDKLRHISYLGRPALFKDAHRLIRINNRLQDANFCVEMRGLGLKKTVEKLPDFVYENDGNYGVDVTKPSKVTKWFDTDNPEVNHIDVYKMLEIPFEEREGKIYCYGSYNLCEVYQYINRIMFACDFFNLPYVEDYAQQTSEYCMFEFIDNGIIPVLDYDYGKACYLFDNGELTNTDLHEACMGIFLKKDLSNLDEFMSTLKKLADNPEYYDEFRNKCFESWKTHADPRTVAIKLIHDICS